MPTTTNANHHNQTVPVSVSLPKYEIRSPSMSSRGISIVQLHVAVKRLQQYHLVEQLIGVLFLWCWRCEWRHHQNYRSAVHAITTPDDAIGIATDDSVCSDSMRKLLPTTTFPFFSSHGSDNCPNPNLFLQSNRHRARDNPAMSYTGTTGRTMSIGKLRPADLPPPELFTDFHKTSTIALPGKIEPQMIHHGTVEQINPIRNVPGDNGMIGTTDIMYLPQIMSIDSVTKVVTLLRNFQRYDEDPDTVDGMTTHEIFVDSPDIQNVMNQYQHGCRHNNEQCDIGTEPNMAQSMKIRDYDSSTLPERTQLRSQLQSILQPILNERITPLVRTQYPKLCRARKISITRVSDTDDRSCTPCFSLIRRYRNGERQSHGTHYDGHAIVTVVVSLSNFSTDYNGGLYVSTGYGQRQFVPLYSGDAIAHQSTLLHGVQVVPIANDTTGTERWSWILWYRDSTKCIDYSYEWFVDCAKRGDAICQELFATKIGNIPVSNRNDNIDEALSEKIRQYHALESIVYWNRASAEQGNGNAAIKMARAYLKLLPSILPYNQTEAVRYYKMAIESHHPDGYYGMANLYVDSLQKKPYADPKYKGKILYRVVQLLEEAAIRGHTYAMFNLGIVHCYGYGIHHIDTDLAASWFIQSGLPEGFFAAAYQAAAKGNISRQQQLDDTARKLGYYEPWRKGARERTGSGGASGVDLNMKWPVAVDGRRPPNF